MDEHCEQERARRGRQGRDDATMVAASAAPQEQPGQQPEHPEQPGQQPELHDAMMAASAAPQEQHDTNAHGGGQPEQLDVDTHGRGEPEQHDTDRDAGHGQASSLPLP